MTRRGMATIVAALALAGGASPALAQHNASPTEARQAAAQYATCLLKVNGYKLRKALDQPFATRGWEADFSKLMSENCAGDLAGNHDIEMRFPPLVMRGMLYETLYAQDFRKTAPIASFEGAPSPAYPFPAEGTQVAPAAKYRVSIAFGECVTRAAPLDSRALLLSPVASPAEAAAIQALAPAFTACVDAGNSLTLSRSLARGAIAEPLYRLTKLRQAEATK